MIVYGFSVQGKSHIERGVICQDYSKYLTLRGGWCLGAVADGVGSAAHSDIGSKTAVESLCEYCKEHIEAEMVDQEIEDMLCSAYEYAFEAVMHYAEDVSDPIEEYDTTLSVALYNGDRVVYGHSGDGGILIRLCDGRIKPITKRQKGVDGTSVLPLRAGMSVWDFGIIREKTAAVLLATDGMLDGVFQPVLVNLPSDAISLARGDFSNDNAYITVSEFFMNPAAVYENPAVQDADALLGRYMQGELDKSDEVSFWDCIHNSYTKMLGEKNAQTLCQSISKYYYAVWALTNVTDDKSVVCMMNEKAEVSPQRPEYYQEPNWKWRQESYNALLYGTPMPPVPHDDPLYHEKRGDTESEKLIGIARDVDAAPEKPVGIESDIDAASEKPDANKSDEIFEPQKSVVIERNQNSAPQMITGQEEKQRDRQKHQRLYLKPNSRKKIFIKSLVIACVCCLAICGGVLLLKSKKQSNRTDNSGNKTMKQTTFAPRNQVTIEPMEDNVTFSLPEESEGTAQDNAASASPKQARNTPKKDDVSASPKETESTEKNDATSSKRVESTPKKNIASTSPRGVESTSDDNGNKHSAK